MKIKIFLIAILLVSVVALVCGCTDTVSNFNGTVTGKYSGENDGGMQFYITTYNGTYDCAGSVYSLLQVGHTYQFQKIGMIIGATDITEDTGDAILYKQ